MFPQSVGGSPSTYLTNAHPEERPLLEQLKKPAPSNAHITTDKEAYTGPSRARGDGSASGWSVVASFVGHTLSGVASHVYHAIAARNRSGGMGFVAFGAAPVPIPTPQQAHQEAVGAWDQIDGAVNGFAEAAKHPAQTVEQLSLVARGIEGDPLGRDAEMNFAKSQYRSMVVEPYKKGGAYGVTGSLGFNVATLLGTGGAAGAAVDAVRVADVAGAVARVGRGVGDMARAAIPPPRLVFAATGDLGPEMHGAGKLSSAAEDYWRINYEGQVPMKGLPHVPFQKTNGARLLQEIKAAFPNEHFAFIEIPRTPGSLFRHGISTTPLKGRVPDDLLILPKSTDYIGDAGIRLSDSFGPAARRARAQPRSLIDGESPPGGWAYVVRIDPNRLMTQEQVARELTWFESGRVGPVARKLWRAWRMRNFKIVVRGDIRSTDVLAGIRVYRDGNAFPKLVKNESVWPRTPPGR